MTPKISYPYEFLHLNESQGGLGFAADPRLAQSFTTFRPQKWGLKVVKLCASLGSAANGSKIRAAVSEGSTAGVLLVFTYCKAFKMSLA